MRRNSLPLIQIYTIGRGQIEKGAGWPTSRFCCPRCKEAVQDANFLHLVAAPACRPGIFTVLSRSSCISSRHPCMSDHAGPMFSPVCPTVYCCTIFKFISILLKAGCFCISDRQPRMSALVLACWLNASRQIHPVALAFHVVLSPACKDRRKHTESARRAPPKEIQHMRSNATFCTIAIGTAGCSTAGPFIFAAEVYAPHSSDRLKRLQKTLHPSTVGSRDGCISPIRTPGFPLKDHAIIGRLHWRSSVWILDDEGISRGHWEEQNSIFHWH